MTKKEWLLFNRYRTKKYYREHGKEEHFRERIRKYNRRAYLKMLLAKKRVTKTLFNKIYPKIDGKI